MKKIAKLLTVGVILLAGVLSTGCKELSNIILQDTANRWYKYVGSDSMYVSYNDKNDQSKPVQNLDNIDVYVYYDSSKGLKVKIQKTFDKLDFGGALFHDIKAGTEKQYEKENPIGDTAWIAMMGFTNIFEPCDAPEETNIDLEDALNGKFDWTQFAANMLYNRYGNGR